MIEERRLDDSISENYPRDACTTLSNVAQCTEGDTSTEKSIRLDSETDTDCSLLKEIKAEIVDESYSMPLFSQDIELNTCIKETGVTLSETSSTLNNISNTEKNSKDEITDKGNFDIKEEITIDKSIVDLKEEITESNDDILIKVEVTEEAVSDALSDFFDPPAKSVGRRRCAPSRGKKRKSMDSDQPDSDSRLCSTPRNGAGVRKSILSTEKKRERSQERPKKRVRFCESGDDVRIFESCEDDNDLLCVQDEESDDSMLKSSENQTKDLVFSETGTSFVNSKVSHVKIHESVSLAELKHSVLSVKTSQNDLGEGDELFSQVSPTSLNEMCSVAIVVEENNNRCHSPVLGARTVLNKNFGLGHSPIHQDKLRDAKSDSAGSGNSDGERKESNNMGTLNSGKSSTTSFPSSDEQENIISKSSVIIPLSLRSKSKRFLYPSTKQIKTTCPESVFGFPMTESSVVRQSTAVESEKIASEHGESMKSVSGLSPFDIGKKSPGCMKKTGSTGSFSFIAYLL